MGGIVAAVSCLWTCSSPEDGQVQNAAGAAPIEAGLSDGAGTAGAHADASGVAGSASGSAGADAGRDAAAGSPGSGGIAGSAGASAGAAGGQGGGDSGDAECNECMQLYCPVESSDCAGSSRCVAWCDCMLNCDAGSHAACVTRCNANDFVSMAYLACSEANCSTECP
jgi:hypothetical protein